MQNGITILTLNRAERATTGCPPCPERFFRAASPARRVDHCSRPGISAGVHSVDFREAPRSEEALLLDSRFNQELLKEIEVLRV
jgi:hypothetical protein